MSGITPEKQHATHHEHPEEPLGQCRQCHHERKRCTKKARFADHDTANTRAQEINEDTSWSMHLVAYRCCWCTGYHLTKAKPGTARWKRSEKRRAEWLARREFHNLLAGVRVVANPGLRDGHLYRVSTALIAVGTRPLTDVELAGLEARHAVRVGLADVLTWLGQDVGSPPVREGRGERLITQIRELRS